MLPQSAALQGGDHAGERQSAEGFSRTLKRWSRLQTFPRGDGPQGPRYKARKGQKEAVAMAVFVLDKRKKPLMPCSEKRARLLLERGRAVVHRIRPFVIRLKDRIGGETQPLRLKMDPGGKTTGLALVREKEIMAEDESRHVAIVLMLMELTHRGETIHKILKQRKEHRRSRRGKLRYRAPRYANRTLPAGWLPPSLRHRMGTTMTWVERIRRWAPVQALSQEVVRFDTQAMENPEIRGIEYQKGPLTGYEMREYLLEKWGRRCAYCDKEDVPLEIDHIQPRSLGGSDRVSNRTLACVPCNQKKGNRDARDFLADDPRRLARIEARRKASLRGAAAVNSTRWALWQRLAGTGLPVESASGGRTKWNRERFGIAKSHCHDAACVGHVDAVFGWQHPVLCIKAVGRGRYQRTTLTRYGFPRAYKTREKRLFGFQTGDIVQADVPAGKNKGSYLGRVTVRANGIFKLYTREKKMEYLKHEYCRLVQRGNGYDYAIDHPADANHSAYLPS